MKARKIELKTIVMPLSANAPANTKPMSFSYVENIEAIVRSPPHRTESVLEGLQVLRALKSANGSLLLDENDYQWLVRKTNSLEGWNDINEEIAGLILEIRNAPTVDVIEGKV